MPRSPADSSWVKPQAIVLWHAINLSYCPTDDMVTDVFTKALPKWKVVAHATTLSMCHTCRGVLDMSSLTDDWWHWPSHPWCYICEFLIQFVFQVSCAGVCMCLMCNVSLVLLMCHSVCGAVFVSVFMLQYLQIQVFRPRVSWFMYYCTICDVIHA